MTPRVADTSTSTLGPGAADIERIGPYEVVATLGRGGMGSVYAVRRTSAFGVERLLAAKVLSAQLLGERHFVNMFIDEARIATLLQHPNVVATLDVLEHEGAPIIVMELLRGRSLDQLLRRAPELSPRVLLAILARAARGLGAVHEARGADGQLLRVIHRDVSPQNVHVGYDGQVKIIDFGIAAARGRMTTTRTGEVKGKLAYLAPEQLSQGNLDHRTDLFALGVVAWEAFARQRLFKQADEAGTMWAIVNKPIPRLRDVAPDVPIPVADVIDRCLARNLRDRPESARVVAKVFAEAAPGIEESEIGALVSDVFAAERAEDEARLVVAPGAAVRAESAVSTLSNVRDALESHARTDPGSTGVPTVSSVSEPRSSRRVAPRVLAASALVGAVVALLLFQRSRAPSDASPQGAQVSAPLAAAPAPRDTFRVRVADDVKLVLVAGKRRDERPLLLDVERGGSVDVSLVGQDGRVLERRLDVSSSDELLSLTATTAPAPSAAPVAASSAARAAKAASRSATKPSPRAVKAAPGLIGNPY